MSAEGANAKLPALIVPRTVHRKMRNYSLSDCRQERVHRLAVAADVRRPGAAGPVGPTVGALIEGLATGVLGIVRMDDPARRVICVQVRPDGAERATEEGAEVKGDSESGPPGPVMDRRCPGDWDE